MHPSVPESLYYLQQPKMKAAQMPSNRQTDKDVVMYADAVICFLLSF